MNGFGVFLVLAGAGLIAGSKVAARLTDPLNQRITGRPRNDRNAYILVGIGFVILGIAVLAGLA